MDVEEYMARAPIAARPALAELRRRVRELVPDAVESVAYGMPAYKHRGKPLVYFGAWKDHCAVYGLDVEAFRDRLADYDIAKGTIRFPHAEPISEALFRDMLMARLAAIERAPSRRSRG